MDYVNPREWVQDALMIAEKKASLGVGDMLVRGSRSGVFLGCCNLVGSSRPGPGTSSDRRRNIVSCGIRDARLARARACHWEFRFVTSGRCCGNGVLRKAPAPLGLGVCEEFSKQPGFYALLFYWAVTNVGATGSGAVGDLLKGAGPCASYREKRARMRRMRPLRRGVGSKPCERITQIELV